MKRGQDVVPGVAYVIHNGRLDPEWAVTERRTLGIAARAIATMIVASGYNDVIHMYTRPCTTVSISTWPISDRTLP